MGNLYEKEYEITYGEVDARKFCRITSMMSFFSDCCLNQEEESLKDFNNDENETTWVFFDYDIVMHRYPNYREKIKVKTYVEAIRKFYATRIFEAYDMENNLISRASVLTFLINKNTRRPARISESEYEAHGLTKESSKLLRDKLKFENFNEYEVKLNFNIRYLDIDLNKHVSNIKYIEWVLETVPFHVVSKYKMNRIKIKFEKEITYGHNVDIKSKIIRTDEGIKVLHKVQDEEGKNITLAETYWY